VETHGPLEAPISVEEQLLPVVAQQGVIRDLRLICPKGGMSAIYSFADIYEDAGHAKLFYSETISNCWQRWAVAKEFIHLLIDTGKKHVTRDPADLLNQLLAGFNSSGAVEKNPEVNSEHVAIFGATELLLPEQFRADILSLKKSGSSDLEIATLYRAPERIVAVYFMDAYQNFLDLAYSARVDCPPLAD